VDYFEADILMAEPTKTHLWINTGIAALALLAAGGSALFSCRNYNLSTESIGLSGTFTYDCGPSFGWGPSTSGKRTPQISLCWKVTVANQSTARTSIVDFASEDETKMLLTPLVPLAHLLTDKGAQLPTPLTLDGGEARTITVRIPVSGTPLLEKMIHDFNAPNNPTLMDFAHYAAQNNLDVLGYPVEKKEVSDLKLIFVTFPANYKGATVSLRLKTGRDNTFSAELHFPIGPFNLIVPRINPH
jgi:hypothetical protein